MNKPYNVIVTGVGGQGISFLTKLLSEVAAESGIFFKGTVFKGGAQRMGSVYSELRFFFDPFDDMQHCAQQIAPGELDLLVGMELWESLRFTDYCNKNTQLILNNYVEPFYQERNPGFEKKDPTSLVEGLPFTKELDDFAQKAEGAFGDTIMANYLMGRRALEIMEPFSSGKMSPQILEKVYKRYEKKGA